MNTALVKRLLLYIVDQLNQKEAPISTIRLVKYLYLIDYEFYKVHSETLTHINWIMYLYGPYFYESPKIIGSLDIDINPEEFVNIEGMKGITYSVKREQKIDDIVDVGTKMMVLKIIKQWAQEELNLLLDYVYADTEPMQNAIYKKSLDFSNIKYLSKMRRLSSQISINESDVKRIKEKFFERKKEIYSRKRVASAYDNEYKEAIKIMNQEDELALNIKGKISFSPEVYSSLSKRGD